MIKKKMWRYYCEFCGKGGCSASHMKKHEEHCTMNPDRKCGLCEVADLEQQKMETLIYAHVKGDLRSVSNECPACMLAALRQSKSSESFDYQAEKKAFFEKHTKEEVIQGG